MTDTINEVIAFFFEKYREDPFKVWESIVLGRINYINNYREAVLFDFLCSGAFLNELMQIEDYADPMNWRVQ
jgi:hypothetical protein